MPTRDPWLCARLRAFRRSAWAVVVRWLTESGAIAESRDPPTKEEDLAALLAAIEAARRRGR